MIVRNRAFYMVLDTLMVIFSYIVTSLLREAPFRELRRQNCGTGVFW